MEYKFNEKKEEYSSKLGKKIPVSITPKYREAKEKAISVIQSNTYDLKESDFWILMNQTKNDKMAYTSLILSHNGCLKINDKLSDPFDPLCISVDKDGYAGTLVYTYCNKEQGIYEVGEVSKNNCTNSYPYAMAFKRCFDRVVLKLSKLAYSGIMSDSESDEFSYDADTDTEIDTPKPQPKIDLQENISEADRKALFNIAKNKFGKDLYGDKLKEILDSHEITGTKTMTYEEFNTVVAEISK